MPVITEMLGYKIGSHQHSWRIVIPATEGRAIQISDIKLQVPLGERVESGEGVRSLFGELLGQVGVKVEKVSLTPQWDDDQFSDFSEFADEEGAVFETPSELQQSTTAVEPLRWKIYEDIQIPIGLEFFPHDVVVRVTNLHYQLQDNAIDLTVELGVYRRVDTELQKFYNAEWRTEIEEECVVKDQRKKQKDQGKLKKVEAIQDDAFPWLDEWLQGKDVFPTPDAKEEQEEKQEPTEQPSDRLVSTTEVENQADTQASEGILSINWEELYSNTNLQEIPNSEPVTQVSSDLYSDDGEWVEPNMDLPQETDIELTNNQIEADHTVEALSEVKVISDDNVLAEDKMIFEDNVLAEDNVMSDDNMMANDADQLGTKDMVVERYDHFPVNEGTEASVDDLIEEEVNTGRDNDFIEADMEETGVDQVLDQYSKEYEADQLSEEVADRELPSADEGTDAGQSPTLWQKINPFKGNNEPRPKQKSSSIASPSPSQPVESRPSEPVVLDGLITRRPLRQHINPGEPPARSGAKKQSTTSLRLYLVKPGDTFATLAEKFSVSISDLRAVNQLDELSVHEMIRIPKS